MGIGAHHRVWKAVAVITLLGFVVRCLAARGGLWLDEAWSAIFAHDVATPAGVFFRINHDNNHHLNTLWLQWVGSDAPPPLQRALSIVSGSATIPVAAAIALRRGHPAAILAAIGFAFAPFLVTYGAEARGYAPMLFAWVAAIAMVDRWLAVPAGRMPSTGLALAAIFGCLSQPIMLFGLTALGGWVAIERLRIAGWRVAAADTTRLFLPAALVTAALIGIAWAAAAASPTGFQFGNRDPHDWGTWLSAVEQLWTWTIGLSAVALLLAAFGGIVRDRIGGLTLLAAVAMPLTVALLALPNSGVSPRYYAIAVPPILLWSAIALPTAWRSGRGWRVVALAVGLAFVAGAAVRDTEIVANLRGDPGRAVAALRQVAPDGAAVAIDYSRSAAILIAAARSQAYRLTIEDTPCPRFRFSERDGDAPFPTSPTACGRGYRTVAQGDPIGLSGSHWRLYARTR